MNKLLVQDPREERNPEKWSWHLGSLWNLDGVVERLTSTFNSLRWLMEQKLQFKIYESGWLTRTPLG